jgi:hypothetical protein
MATYFKYYYNGGKVPSYYNRHHRRVIEARLRRGAIWDDEDKLVGGEKKRKGYTR